MLKFHMLSRKLVYISGTKKIVLVIVEGPSDDSALERYFVKYFDSDRIVTKIIHGDITTDKNIDQSKIKAHLGNYKNLKCREYSS